MKQDLAKFKERKEKADADSTLQPVEEVKQKVEDQSMGPKDSPAKDASKVKEEVKEDSPENPPPAGREPQEVEMKDVEEINIKQDPINIDVPK